MFLGERVSQNLKITFYKNNTNGQIEAFLSTWGYEEKYKQKKIISLKYIPYSTFVDAFSKALRDKYGNPLTPLSSRGPDLNKFKGGCNSNDKNRFSTFGENLIANSSEIYKFDGNYLTPTPPLILTATPTPSQTVTKQQDFTNIFQKLFVKYFPEIIIGSAISTKNSPNTYTYFIDGGCKKTSINGDIVYEYYGNYNTAIIMKKDIDSSHIDRVSVGSFTFSPVFINGKSFINRLINECKSNSYDYSSDFCPLAKYKKNIDLENKNNNNLYPFYLVLKPLEVTFGCSGSEVKYNIYLE
jgi:hypothetical protein